ncbi:MAG: phosphatase PAP2 family protein [Spirosomataceae bacterium]
MKNKIKHIKYATLLAIVLSTIACDKTIEEPQRVGYAPTSLDEKAGTWKPYILGAATDIQVPTPSNITSPEYVAELAALKNRATNLSQTQKEAVVYWGAGAVYRWNEIARELAARYNIPPASNAEGKYPSPDANNPLTDPKFPFANPPYTARALAYLSVAQYDALVSAWHYKYKYKRAAPAKIDASIPVALPTSALPSYPSEDAVVAAASVTVLKAMFPGEIPFLDAKMKEHLAARQWAGMNVESDLAAGVELGNAMSAKVMARAKTDGMSASNNQAATAAMIENAKKIGLSKIWESQELPIRPPMLPTYGNVATWNFDRATLVKIRPAAPPALDSDAFKKDLAELEHINKHQTREQARIANLWSDGVGTYTPPGHWYRRAANASHEAKHSEVKMARTLAVMGTAVMDAGIACWDTKFYYYFPRPQQFGLKTSIGLPNFPSYTSGHSTFSAAAAEVLSYIFPDRAAEFQAEALEVSDSRIYGLIHYRFDCETGLQHGKKIGEYAIARAKTDGSGL